MTSQYKVHLVRDNGLFKGDKNSDLKLLQGCF